MRLAQYWVVCKGCGIWECALKRKEFQMSIQLWYLDNQLETFPGTPPVLSLVPCNIEAKPGFSTIMVDQLSAISLLFGHYAMRHLGKCQSLELSFWMLPVWCLMFAACCLMLASIKNPSICFVTNQHATEIEALLMRQISIIFQRASFSNFVISCFSDLEACKFENVEEDLVWSIRSKIGFKKLSLGPTT